MHNNTLEKNPNASRALAKLVAEGRKSMELPPMSKLAYFQELRACSLRFYQLLQYQTPDILEQLREFICLGEIKQPKEKIPAQFISAPLLPYNMVRTFLLGDFFAAQQELYSKDDAMWEHWMPQK